jgi:hypothetical protein
LVIVDKGTYRGRRVDFSIYATSLFNPFLFTGPVRPKLGCGACALALLTGTPPEIIVQRKRDTHCSDEFMLRFLHRDGYRTLRLTQCNVSLARSNIGATHVLLLSQLLQKNEGTWVVIHNGKCYHNFESYSLEELSFVNKPILSAHIVIHPRWQIHVERGHKSHRKLPRPKGGVTMLALYKAGLDPREGTLRPPSPARTKCSVNLEASCIG